MSVLGIWLVAVAAGGAFAGPVGVWVVGALAGGSVALTHSGRAALEQYTTVLRQLLDSAQSP